MSKLTYDELMAAAAYEAVFGKQFKIPGAKERFVKLMKMAVATRDAEVKP
jgi:hypothetical protein